MNKTVTIRAEIEPDLKAEAEKILAELGLTATETIRLLYRQIRDRRALPFPTETPNKVTARTLRDSKAGLHVRHFATKEALYTDLDL